MAAFPDDPFAANPCIAPEMHGPAEPDRTRKARGLVAKWLIVVLLTWLTFAIIIQLRFGIRLTGEGSLRLTSFVASALLSLLANLASSGAFRQRISQS